MKNIPKKIYLNHGLTNSEMDEVDFVELSEVTWSKDDANGNDLEYVHISQLKVLMNKIKEQDHDIAEGLKLREYLQSQKTGDTIRVILTKVRNDNILYSIVDSLDGELMAMDIKPLNQVMEGIKKLLNNEFNLKPK